MLTASAFPPQSLSNLSFNSRMAFQRGDELL